jgi:hypothetical protein
MSQQKNNIEKTEELIRLKQQELHRLTERLTRIRRTTKLKVSDHAVVRFIERIKVVSVNQVWEELITPQVVRYYHQLGDGTYPINDYSCIRVVIKDAVIVTVLN